MVSRPWSKGHLLGALVFGLGGGAFIGFQYSRTAVVGEAPAAAASAPQSASAAPAKLDAFGRKPGDEHYGHNHPTPGAASSGAPAPQPAKPAPPPGEKDAFGRSPGEEHYGHGHE